MGAWAGGSMGGWEHGQVGAWVGGSMCGWEGGCMGGVAVGAWWVHGGVAVGVWGGGGGGGGGGGVWQDGAVVKQEFSGSAKYIEWIPLIGYQSYTWTSWSQKMMFQCQSERHVQA